MAKFNNVCFSVLFWIILGGCFAHPIEFVCLSEANELGACFKKCPPLDELKQLGEVTSDDRGRAIHCRKGQTCCPVPLTAPETITEQCECGREFSHKFRIINGKKSAEGSHPWMAGIFLENVFHCGGAVITDKYVLTAAHCFPQEDLGKQPYFAIMGVNRLSDASQRVVRRICRVALHRKYDPNNFHNDIALAELSTPVDICGKRLRTICLPTPGNIPNFAGKNFTVAGWGTLQIAKSVLSDILMQISLTGGSIEECKDQFSSFLKYRPDIQFCAGDLEGNSEDACQGDSGGPLISMRSNDSSFEITGITSFGVGCASPEFPHGGYTIVGKFLPWITRTLRSMSRSFEGCSFTLT